MLIAKFIYNNIKNAKTSDIFFELNYKYHFYIIFKKLLILTQGLN